MLKTHNCGELRVENVGETVTLAGWVNNYRDMGGVIFIDLRDRWGLTQIVIDAEKAGDAAYNTADAARSEWVLQVTGTVDNRLEGMNNPNLDTGEVEITVQTITVLNKAKTPPILIDREGGEDEALRLKYRYLDLRRQRMQRNLTVRHNTINFIRNFLSDRDFLEIETPILFKSTPEGARDYLVPSRVHPGKFYALPQSPQQLKQMLMVGGIERYFQVARCFRDEDQRSDRQPEFTQLDIEMSFVEQADIIELFSQMTKEMINAHSIIPLKAGDIPVLTYREAMDTYGSDRPDLSFDMKLVDVSDLVADTGFKVFSGTIKNGGMVKALVLPGCGHYSRKDMADLEAVAKKAGAKGLAFMLTDEEGNAKGGISKFLTAESAAIFARAGVKAGDAIVFGADTRFRANTALGEVRSHMGAKLGLRNMNELALAWVVDFPLFEEELANGRPTPMHHMFTSPKQEQIPMLKEKPLDVLADAYDLICNGFEIAGGSIRIHNRELQNGIMNLIGMDEEEAHDQFGHMLEAFEYGAPPHGGMAFGLDRVVALMTGEPNIREVMAFPKNQQAQDLMADAPSAVVSQQLDDIHLALSGRALIDQMEE